MEKAFGLYSSLSIQCVVLCVCVCVLDGINFCNHGRFSLFPSGGWVNQFDCPNRTDGWSS